MPLTATLSVLTIGLIIVLALFGIFVVVDLFVLPKKAKCRVNQCLTTALRMPGNILKDWRNNAAFKNGKEADEQARPRLLFEGLPLRSLALIMVLMVTVTLFFFIYSATLVRGPATLGLQASFNAPSGPSTVTIKALPVSVGQSYPVYGTLNPDREELAGTIVISGPPTIVFSHCSAQASGQEVEGYARGSQGQIDLGGLASHAEVEFKCRAYVAHHVRGLEVIKMELLAANTSDPEEQTLFLQPPEVLQGQELAEEQSEREVRKSPALWARSSMSPKQGAFKELGAEWPQLDPRHLHGFLSVSGGRITTLRHLENTRVQSSKIVTLHAVITSSPVTVDRFSAEGSGREVVRQVYAIGQSADEQGGWCTTTRSASQRPLQERDHVKLRAAVVEWGRSQASGGLAVMLNCPAVKVLGSIGKPAIRSSSGAVVAPGQFNH